MDKRNERNIAVILYDIQTIAQSLAEFLDECPYSEDNDYKNLHSALLSSVRSLADLTNRLDRLDPENNHELSEFLHAHSSALAIYATHFHHYGISMTEPDFVSFRQGLQSLAYSLWIGLRLMPFEHPASN